MSVIEGYVDYMYICTLTKSIRLPCYTISTLVIIELAMRRLL